MMEKTDSSRSFQAIRSGLAVMTLLLPAALLAAPYHLPQPWRQEAAVEGRDEPYDAERFLHELSFDYIPNHPAVTEEGLRGTGGSVSSRRLYLDMRLFRDLAFDDGKQGILLDIQRSEDLDGSFDRQLVGFRYNVLDKTELWLQGDVYSDKAQSDIYLSARHRFSDQHWLHASWILTDYYFNGKTDTDDRFTDDPYSLFLQWHRETDPDRGTGTTASLTLSPESSFVSDAQALSVDSRSVRGAITHRARSGPLLWHLEIKGERTLRDFRLDGQPDTRFERNLYQLSTAVTHTGYDYRPTLGADWLSLRETGYFGRALDDTGRIRRYEPTLSCKFTLPLTPATSLSPTLYLAAPDIQRTFEENRDRRHTGFMGKLALPFEFLLSPEDGATLTLNATFYLHKAAFGGGNLQLHWPM